MSSRTNLDYFCEHFNKSDHFMNFKNTCIAVLFLAFVTVKCGAQNNILFQLGHKDFGVWAYQQHNGIAKVICDNIKSGKLVGYNAKNLKETPMESLGKIAVQTTVFIQTDPNDPTVGRDSSYMAETSDNYFLFKISGEYILLKPFKGSNNLLKLKRSELFALLNTEQKEYFTSYTSSFALCIDSIPKVSRRIFDNYNVELFEYSKKPTVKLFINDSMNSVWTNEEKENLSKDEMSAFLSTDPDDPTIGRDTLILVDYNLRDTMKEQAIILMMNIENFKLHVNAISCGMERKLMGVMAYTIPFGYLPYAENAPYSATEMLVLNAVMHLKMADALNNHTNYEDMYDDYFMD